MRKNEFQDSRMSLEYNTARVRLAAAAGRSGVEAALLPSTLFRYFRVHLLSKVLCSELNPDGALVCRRVNASAQL